MKCNYFKMRFGGGDCGAPVSRIVVVGEELDNESGYGVLLLCDECYKTAKMRSDSGTYPFLADFRVEDSLV